MNSFKNTQTKKPYCKVCHDAGLSEAEYTSHYVKSDLGPKGKVVCPTLLKQNCRYCLEIGHTVKFCAKRIQQEKMNTKIERKNEYNKPLGEKSLPSINKKNMFDMLNSDSDSDKEVVSKKKVTKKQNKMPTKEEFPALASVPKKETTTMSFIQIANRCLENTEKEKMEQIIAQNAKKRAIPPIVSKKMPEQKKNWADYTSSDDEEDEQEERFVSDEEDNEHMAEYMERLENMRQQAEWEDGHEFNSSRQIAAAMGF